MIDEFVSGERKIAVVGLGYVGLPLCVSFGKVFKQVIGFDRDAARIDELRSGHDRTLEVSTEELRDTFADFTADPSKLKEANVIIVAVPTPVNSHKAPDLGCLKSASETIAAHMSPGTTVVYESTVYPGVTEEFCGPILEDISGMKSGIGFKLGYSPERINPGDKAHTIENVIKIVSGQDDETVGLLAGLYGKVTKAGIHRAPNIKTAEAAKVIENIQRDLNIALVNELSIIFHLLGIDTNDVLDAAKTKWNFMPFVPGLVGGHCIGVDPYYLTYKAQEAGYNPEVILAGRRINDYMGKYVAEQTIKELIKAGCTVKGSRILIMGFSFKENVKDTRNTRVIDIYNELMDYGVAPYVYDPVSDRDAAMREYGIELISGPEQFAPYAGFIGAVRHDAFKDISHDYLESLSDGCPVFIDIKGLAGNSECPVLMANKGLGGNNGGNSPDYRYWRL